MDFDQILAKCGDFNRYQYMILALFGFINIIVSMVSTFQNSFCISTIIKNVLCSITLHKPL